MLRPVVLLTCAVLATLPALTLLAPTASATSLVAVEPANGATLEGVPDAVVLTFSAPLDADAARADVTTPGRDAREADVEVDGPRLVVQVPPSGDGTYVVDYTVTPSGAQTPVEGGVGFTVDPDGEERSGGGTAPWTVASAAAVAGLAAVLVITYRRVQGSR